jgi:hypothetical protein
MWFPSLIASFLTDFLYVYNYFGFFLITTSYLYNYFFFFLIIILLFFLPTNMDEKIN